MYCEVDVNKWVYSNIHHSIPE